MRNLFNPRCHCVYASYGYERCSSCIYNDLGYDANIRIGDIVPYVEILENLNEGFYSTAEIVKCKFCKKNTVTVEEKFLDWCRRYLRRECLDRY